MTLNVREQTENDWPAVWAILKPVFRAGASYPLPQDVDEAGAKVYWIKKDGYNAVAEDASGTIVGVYYLRPDQGGPGAHICNAGYVISEDGRGKGYAAALCRQSQTQARRMGFTGMKFNLVVASNEAAICAWRKAGLRIIGTTPKAFRHPALGLVDAHIMFKELTE